MGKSYAVRRVFYVALLTLGATREMRAAAEIPQTVRTALAANVAALEGQQITGGSKRRLLLDPATAFERMDSLDTEESFPAISSFTVKIGKLRYYEGISHPPGPFHREGEITERAFDGEKYYCGLHRPTDARTPGLLSIETQESFARRVNQSTNPLVFRFSNLSAAGISLPRRAAELNIAPRSCIDELLANGTLVQCGNATVEGKTYYEVVVEYPEPSASFATHDVTTDAHLRQLKPESRDYQMRLELARRKLAGTVRRTRLLLDPDLNYALWRQQDLRPSGELISEQMNEDFILVAGTPLWLPRLSTTKYYTGGCRLGESWSEALYAIEVRLESIERKEFQDGEFRLWYGEPGVMVNDQSKPRADGKPVAQYQVPAPDDALDKLMESGTSGNLRLYLVAANVAIVAGTLGVLTWKRFDKKAGNIR